MGQKIHPINFRLGVIGTWKSKWFSPKSGYRDHLREDVFIRSYVSKKLRDARVEKVEIERSGSSGEIVINIHTAKPGMVIGRGGAGIEELKKDVEKAVLRNQKKVKINIHEVRQAALSAAVVGQNVAADIEKRMPFRRAMRQAMDQVQKAGAKGVKIRVSGRLNGADIARAEVVNWGSIPLHTLRADIDYDHTLAHTTYGVIGVSVWIYRGEVLDESDKEKNTGSEDVLKEIKKITSKKGRNEQSS